MRLAEQSIPGTCILRVVAQAGIDDMRLIAESVAGIQEQLILFLTGEFLGWSHAEVMLDFFSHCEHR